MSVHDQPKQPQAFIGIDWANDQHAFHVITADGTEWNGTLEHSPQAIDDWLATIRQQLPQQRLAIILEPSRGALITALMKYDPLDIYPINPRKKIPTGLQRRKRNETQPVPAALRPRDT